MLTLSDLPSNPYSGTLGYKLWVGDAKGKQLSKRSGHIERFYVLWAARNWQERE